MAGKDAGWKGGRGGRWRGGGCGRRGLRNVWSRQWERGLMLCVEGKWCRGGVTAGTQTED